MIRHVIDVMGQMNFAAHRLWEGADNPSLDMGNRDWLASEGTDLKSAAWVLERYIEAQLVDIDSEDAKYFAQMKQKVAL
jgi:hypothetical protein